MTISPAANATARRNVGQRIERFLLVLEKAHRPPSRREGYHIRLALERVQAGQYPDAEEAMLRAERAIPVPPEMANSLDTNAAMAVETLRELLAKATAG